MLNILTPLEEMSARGNCGIYKVTNILNDKCYIGQSSNLRKRASDYRNAAHKSNDNRRIKKAIVQYGEDNFTFEVILYCNPERLSELESVYIALYDTTNPEKGYNGIDYTGTPSEMTKKLMSIAHKGLKESSATKRKKSNIIFVFAPGHEDLIICDSAKLFGLFIDKTKDMVKNYLRQPYSINSYYLYYANKAKRNEIYEKKLLANKSPKNMTFQYDIENLNDLLDESVETIIHTYNCYRMSYDSLDSECRPNKLFISNGYDASNKGATFKYDPTYIEDIWDQLS